MLKKLEIFHVFNIHQREEIGRSPQPRLGKDGLHVLQSGLQAEAEEASSISALPRPHVPMHLPTHPIHVAHQAAAQTTLENPAPSLESTSRAHDQSQVLETKYHRSKENNPLNDHESSLSTASFFHIYCYTIHICLLTVLLVNQNQETHYKLCKNST